MEPAADNRRIRIFVSSSLYSKGDISGAEALFRRALEASERVLGKEHPQTLASVNNLAGLLESKEDYAGAELLYRRALEGSLRLSAAMGRQHPHLENFIYNYAGCLGELRLAPEQMRDRVNEVLRPFGVSV
jgi:tetratricopeptide (TPR) repeat protein